MKYIIGMTLLVLFSVPVIAGQEEYDDCILKYLKGAKIDVVTHLVKQACQENYKSPSFTSDKKKLFNQCILENLTGIESVPAAMEIKEVCNRKAKTSK
jgi:hypothetical protein